MIGIICDQFISRRLGSAQAGRSSASGNPLAYNLRERLTRGIFIGYANSFSEFLSPETLEAE